MINHMVNHTYNFDKVSWSIILVVKNSISLYTRVNQKHWSDIHWQKYGLFQRTKVGSEKHP